MTSLHMDQEACQAIASRLENAQAMLRNSLRNMTSITESVVGAAWISPSANEYLDQFTEIGDHLRLQADELEALARVLQTEIAAWNSAASRLGG
jgi:uncharacterized protein YukE